jgi:hypothetical protein
MRRCGVVAGGQWAREHWGLADLLSPGQDKEMQSYSTLKAVTTRATVSGLKPGTRYVFQVRARTSAGCGRFSQAMEVETGKPRECREPEGQGAGPGRCRALEDKEGVWGAELCPHCPSKWGCQDIFTGGN